MQAALAWQAEQRLICPGCNHPRDETMAPDAEGAYDAEPWVCFACQAKARASRRFTDGDDAGSSDGLFFTVSREMTVA